MTLDRNRYMTRAEALQALIERWKPEPARETVVLAQSQGRICAGDVFSRNCLPVCRSSQVDGIAVRFADFESGMPVPKAGSKTGIMWWQIRETILMTVLIRSSG